MLPLPPWEEVLPRWKQRSHVAPLDHGLGPHPLPLWLGFALRIWEVALNHKVRARPILGVLLLFRTSNIQVCSTEVFPLKGARAVSMSKTLVSQ